MSLSSSYLLQGNLSSVIRQNARFVLENKTNAASWLVKRAWNSLLGLLQTSASETYEEAVQPIILGNPLLEKLILDMLELFLGLGDVQMLGMLACLIELDRRCRLVFRRSPFRHANIFSDSLCRLEYAQCRNLSSIRTSWRNRLFQHEACTPVSIQWVFATLRL